jgi:hypothetical protein
MRVGTITNVTVSDVGGPVGDTFVIYVDVQLQGGSIIQNVVVASPSPYMQLAAGMPVAVYRLGTSSIAFPLAYFQHI